MNSNSKLLTIAALAATAASPALSAQIDRDGTTPTNWWMTVNESAAGIQARSAQGYRPIDVDVRGTNPLRMVVTYVRNTGDYQKSWTLLLDKTATEVSQALNGTNRILDLSPYRVGNQTRYCALLVGNTGSQAKTWYWWPGRTLSYIQGRLTNLNARLIDMDSYVVNGTRYYSAVAIKNTGADARQWQYVTDRSFAQIKPLLSQLGMRVYDIERRSPGRYDLILVKPTKTISRWWYVGKTFAEVDALTKQNGARVTDLERYIENGVPRYAVAMLQNTNELTTRVGRQLRGDTDGSTGFVLQRLNGARFASLQPEFQFDPASTIKQLHGAYAFYRARVSAQVTPETNIPFRDGPCPYTTGNLVQEELQLAVRRILTNSDNRRVDAIEKFFGGKASLHAFANSLGMTKTRSNRVMGCTAPPYNTMTLSDLVRLHTEIQNGLLGPYRESFLSRMLRTRSNFPARGTRNLVAQMDTARLQAGVTALEYANFLNRFRVVYKPGAKTINGKFHQTTSGWMEVPFVVNHKVQLRQYAFGVFAHAASNSADAQEAISQAAHTLVMDRIAAALATWKGYSLGSLDQFGTSCSVGRRTPVHSASGTPVIGNFVSYKLRDGSILQPNVMWIGLSRNYWGRTPLPLSLGFIGAPGCMLYTSPIAAISGMTDQSGSRTLFVPVNAPASAVGLAVYTQFAMVAPRANSADLATTNAVRTIIGGSK